MRFSTLLPFGIESLRISFILLQFLFIIECDNSIEDDNKSILLDIEFDFPIRTHQKKKCIPST